MLHQVALYAGGPIKTPGESSRNRALPCAWDADHQDDQRLLGYVRTLGDHESILTRRSLGAGCRPRNASTCASHPRCRRRHLGRRCMSSSIIVVVENRGVERLGAIFDGPHGAQGPVSYTHLTLPTNREV